MSQPNPVEHHDPDPLLAFFEESPDRQPAEAADTVEAVHPVEVAVNAQDPRPPGVDETGSELRKRLERAERQIERALLDISTLKTDLATLVSAVEDIRKRLSRPPAFAEGSGAAGPAQPPAAVVLPPRKLSKLRTVAAIVLLVTAGAALWGFYSVATYDLPEPPLLETESSSAATEPSVVIPVAASASPPPAFAKGSGETGSARDAPASAPARDAPATSSVRRAVNYVGTLTIDADPSGDVYLNRTSVGRTPVRLENLRAGSHLIWIERDGYRRWTRVVAVAADRISRVSASLDPVSR